MKKILDKVSEFFKEYYVSFGEWVLSIVMRKIFQKNFLSVTCKLLLECI